MINTTKQRLQLDRLRWVTGLGKCFPEMILQPEKSECFFVGEGKIGQEAEGTGRGLKGTEEQCELYFDSRLKVQVYRVAPSLVCRATLKVAFMGVLFGRGRMGGFGVNFLLTTQLFDWR